MQSSYVVCCILELTHSLIKQEVPTMSAIKLETDNEKQYINDILPVFTHFLCQKYGIRLDKIVHNDTCNEEGSADIHFATGMRLVNRFIH